MTVFSKNQVFLWGLLASSYQLASAGKTCAVADSVKADCGFSGVDQTSCEAKGCCWVPVSGNTATPWCYFAGQSAPGYTLTKFDETPTGFVGELNLNGAGSNTYGPDLKHLRLEVVFESADVLRVKITDAKNQRWEIPQSIVHRPHATSKPASLNYKFSYNASPFSFEVTRVSDGVSLFKLDNDFTFKDQYFQFTTSRDAKAKTFGLGETTRLQQALPTGKTYSMWATDIAAFVFDTNLYGSYPFYLEMLNGKAHGAMLMNSNGLDVDLQDTSLTFKSIGGIVDLYVFSGSSPSEVVSQYTSIVGRPTMMPYWSFGFHNCKWGYTSLQEVQEVVANYSAASIPLETQWMDIDYMQNYRDFSYDSEKFPQAQVADFVDQLHAKGQHFVPIVDPGIMTYEGYEAYDRGVREGLFIKDVQGNNYLGQVWPGPTHYPDFFNPNTQSYWTDQLKDFLSLANADGIWIDMNEVKYILVFCAFLCLYL
jgi:alpha-D-xyloside xylohydrolase